MRLSRFHIVQRTGKKNDKADKGADDRICSLIDMVLSIPDVEPETDEEQAISEDDYKKILDDW